MGERRSKLSLLVLPRAYVHRWTTLLHHVHTRLHHGVVLGWVSRWLHALRHHTHWLILKSTRVRVLRLCSLSNGHPYGHWPPLNHLIWVWIALRLHWGSSLLWWQSLGSTHIWNTLSKLLHRNWWFVFLRNKVRGLVSSNAPTLKHRITLHHSVTSRILRL